MRSRSFCCSCFDDFTEADLWKEREPFVGGFADPFSSSDATVRRWIGGCLLVYAQKLDWILLDGRLEAIGKGLGNGSMALSDHAYIYADVSLRMG